MNDTLTLLYNADHSIEVIGDAPPLIYIADELLNKADPEHVWIGGSNLLIKTDPPLRYVITRRSALPEHQHHTVWIAEKVAEFAS